jgi:hypothetical protein
MMNDALIAEKQRYRDCWKGENLSVSQTTFPSMSGRHSTIVELGCAL